MAAKTPYKEGCRLRLFGGPNGSGKSTIFNLVSQKYDLGIYLNPDQIEQNLSRDHHIDLHHYGISLDQANKFLSFLERHTIIKKAEIGGYNIDLHQKDLLITNPDRKTHSYEASLVVDFIRSQLIASGKKLSFETVMSHESKLDILDYARQTGYKNYLYYISTESPDININRVAQRVSTGGHFVPTDKIVSRYHNSMNLLKSAINKTYRAYIFDNSEEQSRLILEVFEGKEIIYHYNEVPKWIDQYLLGSYI